MLLPFFRCLVSAFKTRRELALENLALRQQLAILLRSVKRPVSHQNASAREIKDLRAVLPLEIREEEGQTPPLCSVFASSSSLGAHAIRAICRRRAELVIENLALRQQVAALKKERPRPPLEDMDRAFWVALRKSWPGWASRVVIVNADTVARWSRERFRRYWAKI